MAKANWYVPDVICGHADPVHFATDLEMDDRFFAEVDRVELAPTRGEPEPPRVSASGCRQRHRFDGAAIRREP